MSRTNFSSTETGEAGIMKLTANIKMDNAAFEDDGEIVKLVHEIAEHIEDGNLSATIYDSNGNRVGTYTIK